MVKINHIELFSGIDGFRQAIECLGVDTNILMNCIGFSEIDKYAIQTYKPHFNTETEIELGDIVDFTSSGVSNHQLYKQSGNAVSVNVVYAILYYIMKMFDIIGE